ncbi:hypothetical protein K438DRAFT_1935123 [Mycena galopus ATCC 62051]|nr:hypothetical protein K438DRAFT_1935123 [Mycena galopus ATCC 62051]
MHLRPWLLISTTFLLASFLSFLPMFQGSSGFQIYGASLFQVAGDVNIRETRHHVGVDTHPRLVESPGAPFIRNGSFLETLKGDDPDSQHHTASRPRRFGPDIAGNDCSRRDAAPPPGTFIHANSINNHYGGGKGLDILDRHASLEALYNSADSFPQPRCHPETRTKMLDALYRWTTTSGSRPSVHWLHGPAGAGKSAIMQMLCQRLQDARQLGGSFFFKRGHPTRGNAKSLFTTLAYQLALHNAKLKFLIVRKVKEDPTVVRRDMNVQLQELIAEPCQTLGSAVPFILLIDGLDECADEEVQQQILALIGNTARQHPSMFRFLVASRPEASIRSSLRDVRFLDILDSTNVQQSFEDVQTYLLDEFARIYHKHSETMGIIPTPWPPPAILNSLVQKSSGYFIYASTIIKFIDDEYAIPTERLEVVQNLGSTADDDRPFETLDRLYRQILSSLPLRFQPKLPTILCVIHEFPSLSPEVVDMLLQLKPGTVMLALRGLSSLIAYEKEKQLRHLFHHASFLDFLRDPQRSAKFHISAHHRIHVAQALLKTHSHGGEIKVLQALLKGLQEYSCIWDTLSVWSYIVSMPACTQLEPYIRNLNPDCLWLSLNEDIFLQMHNWLEVGVRIKFPMRMQPTPRDLISLWDDYHSMALIETLQRKTHAMLIYATRRRNEEPATSIIISPRPESSSPGIPRLFGRISIPALLLHRYSLADRLGCKPMCLHVHMIRDLLSVSWEDMRAALYFFHTTIEPATRPEGGGMFAALLRVSLEHEFIVSGDLACGLLRALQRTADGDLPAWFRPNRDHFKWGSFVRRSPQSNEELLKEIERFIPRLDNREVDYLHRPVEFYNVLQWLKTSPNPQFNIIRRWEGYLQKALGDRARLRDIESGRKFEAGWKTDFEASWKTDSHQWADLRALLDPANRQKLAYARSEISKLERQTSITRGLVIYDEMHVRLRAIGTTLD